MAGKIIILSAPSGSGKSTVIGRLIKNDALRLEFSVSATSRSPRGEEKHGREYYFLTDSEFNEKIANGEFVEWEEVYSGHKYGTLISEVNRVLDKGSNLILDIDVKGALNIKKQFPEKSLSIFIQPPSVEELERRLRARGTDSPEVIEDRIKKAEYELSFAPSFDKVVVNDNLEEAVAETTGIIESFINR